MSGTVVLAKDEWLSGLLGKPCHHVSGALVGLRPGQLPPGPCFVGAKVPAQDAAALLRLQAAGFAVVDVNVQFERPASRLVPGWTDPGARIRHARPGDEDGVRALARSAFLHNRFHRDPEVGPDLAGRIKEEWAANFFAGRRGQWMLVAEEAGALAGFLLLLSGPEGSVVVDLVAVAEPWRGRSLGKAMLAHAWADCGKERAALRAGTQLGNDASLRLYTGLGFRQTAAAYVLHLHKKASEE